MSRRRSTLAVLMVVGLVVTAIPASVLAADAGLEVASEHTTDSDFSAASLTNMSVSGTGESALVAMNDDLRLANDTFNDGDHDGWTELQSSWSVSDGQLQATGTSGTWEIEKDSPTHTTENLNGTLQFSLDNGFSGQDVRFYPVYQDSNNFVRIRWISDSTDITMAVFSGGSKVAEITGTWAGDTANHTVRVINNSGTWEFYVDGSLQGTTAANTDLSGKSRIWYELDTITDTRGLNIDNFDVESGSAPQTAQYVSANHSASEIEEGRVDLALTDVSATITWQEWTGSAWSDVNSTTVSSSGVHTLDLSSASASKWRVKVDFSRSDQTFTAELEDEAVLFQAATPTVDNSSASPNDTTINKETVTFSIDVNDSDFATAQGDSVTVEFHTNTSGVIGSDTLTSNGTASISADVGTGGDVKWWVVATDDYGESQRSANFTVTVPSQITVVEERTLDIVNESGDASVKFFFDESDMVVERDVNNGNISLAGLPVGEPFVVRVSLDGYYTRRVYLEDIFTQSRVFVLNKSANASDVVFKLNDKTGNFPTGSTVLFIDKPITDDFDDDGTNETQYVTIAGDFFGASGEFPITLHTDARYRIRIKNSEGEVRTLGAYEATADDVATLDVGKVTFPAAGADGYVLDASLNDDGTAITIKWQDIANNSSDLHITVFERGNQSNELFDEVVNGTVQEYSRTISLTSDQQDTQWIVHWRITRDGNRLNIKLPVGGLPVDMPLDPKWIGSTVLVFGTFVALLHGGELSTWGAIVMMAFVGVMMMFQWVDIAVEFYLAGGLIAVFGHLRARGGAA